MPVSRARERRDDIRHGQTGPCRAPTLGKGQRRVIIESRGEVRLLNHVRRADLARSQASYVLDHKERYEMVVWEANRKLGKTNGT